MLKLGPIHVNNSILDAIRDDQLVIFAGAGVSMGPPAHLPDFNKLAKKIADGSGLITEENEPIDRFLGRLAHIGVKVQQRAAQLLSNPESAPTTLHLGLMRLFRNSESVRLVTTNFDLHFETAAQKIFGGNLDVFSAPALPLGRDFHGLVHVHGTLTHPSGMVLTDTDFGRGYLTEGWARRFLVDVFRTYTVLFVGYSHNDVVMNYLARALPADGVQGRYALTDEDGNWKLLGITPIPFCKGTGKNVFQELYDGIDRLAAHTTRGTLAWQSRLAEIGSQPPPIDEETIGEVEQALREVHTTRFLINVARRPEWPKWLDDRKQLDPLFDIAPLNERDKLLAEWLAEHYAINYADELIGLVVTHDMRLSPLFLWALGREVGGNDKKALDNSVLSRWVSVLLFSAAAHTRPHEQLFIAVLPLLAARCAKQNDIKMALEIFLCLASYRMTITPRFERQNDEGKESNNSFAVKTTLCSDHYNLNKVWEIHLKPNLHAIAQPLVSGIVRRLEEIHHALVAWNKASRDWDGIALRRSAIESHVQDKYPESMDVLINAGRDVLEWLSIHQPILSEAWMEKLIVSDVPLLRRLAIHALTVQPPNSPDASLSWLMNHIELYARAEHHEIYRAIALFYPLTSIETRQRVIKNVLQYRSTDNEDPDRTVHAHFNWLVWLHQSDPECGLVQEALAPIKTNYPTWVPREYPDLTYWSSSGSRDLQSPWTVEQLLSKSPTEQLDNLLSFKDNQFEEPSRDGLCSAIQEACKQQPTWAFQLEAALAEHAHWTSDLWPPILSGLREAELTLDEWALALKRISCRELYSGYPHEISDFLYAIVRNGGKPFALNLLEQADIIGFDLWQSFSRSVEKEVINDWFLEAINHPAGVLVQFWVHSLSLRLHGKSRDERMLPDNYRQWFTAVVDDETNVGGMGRSVLASQVAFLFGIDEKWTHKNVIALLSSADLNKFKQAWDGFLGGGQMTDSFAEDLQQAFLFAFQRLDIDLRDRRSRFIEFFTALVIFYVDDPIPNLFPALFKYASLKDRETFASKLGFFIQNMTESDRQDLWQRWLYAYWQNRLVSIPVPLIEEEAQEMLDWLPHLGENFPKSVSFAVLTPLTGMRYLNMIHDLRESDLIIRFPADMAKLLIYLCPYVFPHQGAEIREIARQLPAFDADLQKKLNESMACAGFFDILPMQPGC